MKKIIVMVACMLIWGGQALAVQTCLTTITASTPTADFIDYGNGTVRHTKTGLMWKQCSEGLSGAGCAIGAATPYTWQGALQAAQTLDAGGGFAGFTDWRVPNIKELHSIVEVQCGLPAINATIFPATVSNSYWQASPYAGFAPNAWSVHFGDGSDNNSYLSIKSNTYYVRLVRGGL